MGGKVVIAGGGTAGHVYPGLALARVLRQRGHEVVFAGTERGLESKLVPAAGFGFHAMAAQPLVRKVSLAAVRAPITALGAVRECRPLVRGDFAVIGMGGYASVPTVLAARVREEILRVPGERDRLAEEGRTVLGLEEGRRTVVVFGGSQGALHLDRATLGAARLMAARSDLQVVVLTGTAHVEAMARALPPGGDGILVRLFGYLDRMELAYAVADLVVARAGATTIAELSVCGLPSLLIPYPYATRGHQEANARALQRTGGAGVMLDDQLSAETLAGRIESLVDHPERLLAMSERAAAFGHPDAAFRLADLVEEVGAA